MKSTSTVGEKKKLISACAHCRSGLRCPTSRALVSWKRTLQGEVEMCQYTSSPQVLTRPMSCSVTRELHEKTSGTSKAALWLGNRGQGPGAADVAEREWRSQKIPDEEAAKYLCRRQQSANAVNHGCRLRKIRPLFRSRGANGWKESGAARNIILGSGKKYCRKNKPQCAASKHRSPVTVPQMKYLQVV